jgi:hypothetical protein
MDISGRWVYNREKWNERSHKESSSSNFAGSLFCKYLELPTFELICTKIISDGNEENILLMPRAPRLALHEEKHSLSHLTITDKSSASFVFNCEKEFTHFSLGKFGPKPNQSCTEHFHLDPNGRLHMILITCDDSKVQHTITRSFERIEDPSTNVQKDKINFLTAEKTFGLWSMVASLPSQIFELFEIKLLSVVRFKADSDSDDGRETLFSTDGQTQEQKQSILFNEENQSYRHLFQFQVTAGDKVWTFSRTFDEIKEFFDFLKIQLASNESVGFMFKKMPSSKNWKTYVEFNRQLTAIENCFRSLLQNSEILNNSCLYATCYLFQVSFLPIL